ncbi:MAG TPA: preprotein translocase subunit YajC [Pirellulales bacterium]|nr:preprotein translocase subunit YajC [Pirellulales bacterium]
MNHVIDPLSGWLAVLPRHMLLAEAEGSPMGGLLPLITMFLPLLLLWIFLLERPRRKQMAQREQMLKGIKKNDRVLTNSGIYGVVTNVQTDVNEITIRVDEASNTKLRMTLGSIDRILSSDTSDKPEATN